MVSFDVDEVVAGLLTSTNPFVLIVSSTVAHRRHVRNLLDVLPRCFECLYEEQMIA